MGLLGSARDGVGAPRPRRPGSPRHRSVLRRVSALLLALPVATRATTALACGPGSLPPDSAPRQGTIVPANIPGIYVYPGYSYYDEPCTLAGVELSKQPSGSVSLAQDPKDPSVFAPLEALEVGAFYTLSFSSTCSSTGPSAKTFQVAEARPPATRTGQLRVVATGLAEHTWADGSCSWNGLVAWAELRLRPSCDLEPFLPLTRFTLLADGKPWRISPVGLKAGAGTEAPPVESVDLAFAACALSPLALSPGKTELELRAHVSGTDVDPEPAKLTIELDCADADAATLNVPKAKPDFIDLSSGCISDFDASDPELDAGLEDGAASDAEAPGAPADLRANGGCSLSAPGRAGAWVLFAVSWAALLIARRASVTHARSRSKARRDEPPSRPRLLRRTRTELGRYRPALAAFAVTAIAAASGSCQGGQHASRAPAGEPPLAPGQGPALQPFSDAAPPESTAASYAAFFASEARDDGWATAREASLRQGYNVRGTTILRVGCKSTLCRVNVAFATEEELEDFASSFPRRWERPLLDRTAAFADLDQSRLEGVVYVSKPGCSLPQGQTRGECGTGRPDSSPPHSEADAD